MLPLYLVFCYPAKAKISLFVEVFSKKTHTHLFKSYVAFVASLVMMTEKAESDSHLLELSSSQVFVMIMTSYAILSELDATTFFVKTEGLLNDINDNFIGPISLIFLKCI